MREIEPGTDDITKTFATHGSVRGDEAAALYRRYQNYSNAPRLSDLQRVDLSRIERQLTKPLIAEYIGKVLESNGLLNEYTDSMGEASQRIEQNGHDVLFTLPDTKAAIGDETWDQIAA